MKQKKFKIAGTTLFVYRPRANGSSQYAQDGTTDPTTATSSTIISTGVFRR